MSILAGQPRAPATSLAIRALPDPMEKLRDFVQSEVRPDRHDQFSLPAFCGGAGDSGGISWLFHGAAGTPVRNGAPNSLRSFCVPGFALWRISFRRRCLA